MTKSTKKLIFAVVVIALSFVAKKNLSQTKSPSPIKGNSDKIIITKHAKCRMKCRNIDRSEIDHTLKKGKVNRRKSNYQKKPCPIESREAFSQKDKQKIRVVAAKCLDVVKIITVIDLDNEYQCNCR